MKMATHLRRATAPRLAAGQQRHPPPCCSLCHQLSPPTSGVALYRFSMQASSTSFIALGVSSTLPAR